MRGCAGRNQGTDVVQGTGGRLTAGAARGECDRNGMKLSRPYSRSDQICGSEPSSGCETQDWDSLPDFFFKPNLYLWVWLTSYNIIKRTTTGVVSIKIYTHITESHLLIHIQK